SSGIDRAFTTSSAVMACLPSGLADTLLLIARVLLGYIFLLSGWGKLTGLAGFATDKFARPEPF
ncbi:MAG: DoxX family membrane protein, partial [Rhodoplanes sp.]